MDERLKNHNPEAVAVRRNPVSSQSWWDAIFEYMEKWDSHFLEMTTMFDAQWHLIQIYLLYMCVYVYI